MSVRSLLLGLDVSPRRLGWGLVDLVTGEPIACGCEAIDLPDHGWAEDQVKRALREVNRSLFSVSPQPSPDPRCKNCDGRGCMGCIFREHPHECAENLCPICCGEDRVATEIQAVYLEQPALPPKSGGKAAFMAGRAFQAAWDEVGRRWPWAPREVLQPSEWRKLAGLPGNASKADVWRSAWGRLVDCDGADWSPHDADQALAHQDAADALLVAVAGQRRNGETWDRAVATGAA